MKRIALLITLMLFASSLSAQQPQGPAPGPVAGIVLDASTEAPIAGALISLPELNRRSFSDAQGRFVLPNLPPGSYYWHFRQLGYADLEGEFTVAEGAYLTVRLHPQPVVLQGVTVTANRLEERRRAVSTSVRMVDRQQILTSAAANAYEVVASRSGARLTVCREGVIGCAWVRGRLQRVNVCIDERQAIGGLEELLAYSPQELYLIESYGGGREVRVYTLQFMENLARRPRTLLPIGWIGSCA